MSETCHTSTSVAAGIYISRADALGCIEIGSWKYRLSTWNGLDWITSRSTSCIAALQSQHITFSLITAGICYHDLFLRSEWVFANIAKFANLFLLTLIRLNMIISNLYTFSIHIWRSLDGLILCEQHNYSNLNHRLARGSDAFNLSETKKEKKTDELFTILTWVSLHVYILFQISALELWWSYILTQWATRCR